MALDSAADLVAWALQRAGEAADGTSTFADKMQNILAERWRKLWSTTPPFLGLRAYPPQAFITQPASATLLLTTTANSAAAVLSAAPTGIGGALVSIVNWWIMPIGKTYYLRVSAHVSGSTALTLDTVAPESLSALGCTIAQLEYPLVAGTGILADGVWTEGNGYDGAFVKVRSEEELKLEWPGIPGQSWPPALAARIAPLILRFSHYDLTSHRVEVPYQKEPADPDATSATALAIPTYLRPALAEGMLAILYELKQDSRRPLADARYDQWIDQARAYETALKTGGGDKSNERVNEPYGEASYRSPWS